MPAVVSVNDFPDILRPNLCKEKVSVANLNELYIFKIFGKVSMSSLDSLALYATKLKRAK